MMVKLKDEVWIMHTDKGFYLMHPTVTCSPQIHGLANPRVIRIEDEHGNVIWRRKRSKVIAWQFLEFAKTCCRGARELTKLFIFGFAVVICLAAAAAIFVGPGMLADKYSMWWLLLYTPHALWVLYLVGEDD